MLAPAIALVALPQVVVNLLANDPGPTDPHEHYVAGILPFVFAAIAIGLSRLSVRSSGRVALLVLVSSVAATVAIGPWPRTLLGAGNWGPPPDHAGICPIARSRGRAGARWRSCQRDESCGLASLREALLLQRAGRPSRTVDCARDDRYLGSAVRQRVVEA